jgi:hypothetical protein
MDRNKSGLHLPGERNQATETRPSANASRFLCLLVAIETSDWLAAVVVAYVWTSPRFTRFLTATNTHDLVAEL